MLASWMSGCCVAVWSSTALHLSSCWAWWPILTVHPCRCPQRCPWCFLHCRSTSSRISPTFCSLSFSKYFVITWIERSPGGDKVSMLTHTYFHTNPWGRLQWPYAIARLTANFIYDLMSDLVICKFRKSIHNIECPYWDQMSLNNTNWFCQRDLRILQTT